MNRDKHIKLALEEDCCRQDVTTKLLPIDKRCKAIVKIKETSHVYGISWREQVFKQIDKKVKIKLKEGLQSGKILRLKGKGLPSYNQYGTGDLIIHVNVWTPQDLSSEQKKFFEKSQKSDNFTPDNNRNEMSFFEKIKQMFDL